MPRAGSDQRVRGGAQVSEAWRVVICGSRDIPTSFAVLEIERYFAPLICRDIRGGLEVCSGESGNVDTAARRAAKAHGLTFKPFPADWNAYGRGAGILRNEAMAKWGREGRHVELLAVWDGRSTGTADMILRAHRHGFNQVCTKIVKVGGTAEMAL